MELIKYKSTLLIFLLSVFSLIIFGQENKNDINQIKKRLESHFSEIKNINCKYKQERTLKMLTEPIISSGNFTFFKNKELTFFQKEPFLDTIILNSNNQIKEIKYLNEFILSIISGEIINDKKVEATYISNEEFYIINIIPKKGVITKKISHFKLSFLKSNLNLAELLFYDIDNQLTKINFFEFK